MLYNFSEVKYNADKNFMRQTAGKGVMKMKKLTALILIAVMVLVCFAGCGAATAQSDSAYVKEKGTLVIGITDFKPMDFQQDGSDEWVGFDADLAKAFAAELGVDAEFVVINWDNKDFELNSKSIDCVWNGMTLTDGVKAAMETSNAYCKNAQVVVVPKDKAALYQTADSVKSLSFAAEGGSAGEEALLDLGYSVTPVTAQTDAVKEVAAGTSDAAVIDLLMAGAMLGEGSSYEDLTYTVELTYEEYGVGFRRSSDLAQALNDFFVKVYADGTMNELAEKYDILKENVIEQK